MEHHGNCHVPADKRQPAEAELSQQTETILRVWGMGCPTCAMRVRNALIGRFGVIDAQVDHFSGRALVRYNPQMVAPDELLKLVESAGNDGRHRYSAALP